MKTRVHERLNRLVASSFWTQAHPHIAVEHLLKYNSADHSPILLRTRQKSNNMLKRDNAFKLETAWLFDDSCEQVVRDSWCDGATDSMIYKWEGWGLC